MNGNWWFIHILPRASRFSFWKSMLYIIFKMYSLTFSKNSEWAKYLLAEIEQSLNLQALSRTIISNHKYTGEPPPQPLTVYIDCFNPQKCGFNSFLQNLSYTCHPSHIAEHCYHYACTHQLSPLRYSSADHASVEPAMCFGQNKNKKSFSDSIAS